MWGNTHLQRCFIHYYLVIPRLDQATAEVLDLFSCLDEQVPTCRREPHRYTLPSVARPDIETRVPRAAVDGQEVEIRVKSCKDRILLTIFDQIGGCRSEEMRTVSSEVSIPRCKVRNGLLTYPYRPASRNVF